MVVLRKSSLLASVAMCGALLLASCGDDDNAPTPTPTDSPTPSPTPTETPTPTATDFDFAKDFEASVSNTSYIYAYFTPAGEAEVFNGSSRFTGLGSVNYAASPNTVAYSAPDSTEIRNFAAADLESAAADIRTYRKGAEGLVMELPFEHILRVSYERVDAYVRETVAGDLRSNRVTLFFNSVTTSDAITTNLSYTGSAQVVGGKPGETAPETYSSPTATLTVAASDKKVSGTIQIVTVSGGTTTVVAEIPISATLTDKNVLSGDIKDTARGFTGKYIGSLAGPNREEAFVIFELIHTDGRRLLGSFIAN
ncbi:hypothetical protein [Pseudoblastomonas halimionae]|uniref:Transferrin-binding protein B C-lobe/N-lobe beta barrel domain-containing protein n=1 Tax=Alteriqipengyuania halimionae TaxID=1926630 RepID=A0A6I4U106_9SPHN|nr:hypothetical protein [Alteriqipengyuania halimionae]MXP08615.1 hypothetical protein [Alteriqipengyuania halimionae]